MKIKMPINDFADDYEGWSFVHFRTSAPAYILADSLNHIYRLALRRIADMAIVDAQWPLFTYHDSRHHLFYYLTERPSNSQTLPWQAGDKLLVIKGENSATTAQRLCADFAAQQQPEQSNLVAAERAVQMQHILAYFTLATPLTLGDEPNSRRTNKEQATVRQTCNQMLDYIESQHLDLGEKERRRLEMDRMLHTAQNKFAR